MVEILIGAVGPALMTGLFGLIMWRLQRSDKDREQRHQKTDTLLETAKDNAERIGDLEVTFKELHEITKELKEISEVNGEGVKGIMRYMLQRYHAEYLLQGYITSKQKSEFLEAYGVYKAKGGNGTAEGWKNEVDRLPIRDDLPSVNPYLQVLKAKGGESHD